MNSDWIQTKAGLQMAQSIATFLPKIASLLDRIRQSQSLIALNSNHAQIVRAVEQVVDDQRFFQANMDERLSNIEKDLKTVKINVREL